MIVFLFSSLHFIICNYLQKNYINVWFVQSVQIIAFKVEFFFHISLAMYFLNKNTMSSDLNIQALKFDLNLFHSFT